VREPDAFGGHLGTSGVGREEADGVAGDGDQRAEGDQAAGVERGEVREGESPGGDGPGGEEEGGAPAGAPAGLECGGSVGQIVVMVAGSRERDRG
jgi:hypothetical protein